MKPTDLIVKCYAEQEKDFWVAVCLNFNLAAQDDTFEAAKAKLEGMITEYLYDALAGEDKPYSAQLLSRRAPLSSWLKYYFIRINAIIWQ